MCSRICVQWAGSVEEAAACRVGSVEEDAACRAGSQAVLSI